MTSSRNFDFLFLNSRLKREDVSPVGPEISSGGQRPLLKRWEELLVVLLMTLSCEDTWKTAGGHPVINATTTLTGREFPRPAFSSGDLRSGDVWKKHLTSGSSYQLISLSALQQRETNRIYKSKCNADASRHISRWV